MCICPARKAFITRSFSSVFIWPCSRPIFKSGNISLDRKSASSVAAWAWSFSLSSINGQTT